MDWTPDQIRALAEALQECAERDRLVELTPRTARLVVEALRLYAAEAFALRWGTAGEVVGEASDLDLARAVFDAACRRRPGSRITMRKRGWVVGMKRPGDEPLDAA